MARRFLRSFGMFIMVCLLSQSIYACMSDFDCGIGKRCVKAPYNTNGVCMQSVDSYGTPQYNLPSLDSMNIKTKGECNFDVDCPIGFYCDGAYKVCVKR